MSEFKLWLHGAVRSLTVWFSVILAALPDTLALLQANFDTLRPFIPDVLESRWLNVLALLILLLRLRTSTSLAEKGRAALEKE